MLTPMAARVSIVVACRNEGEHIREVVDSILAQDLEEEWEAIFSDGQSEDETGAILRDYCARHPRLHFVENPERIVSTGLNRAIEAAQGDIIVRMDAHTRYREDYCRQCVEVLESTGADNVGGAARTIAAGVLARAIEAAFHSPFSTGGGKFHDQDYEGWVDTVPYGCWRKEALLRAGLFDVALVRNQDDELNLRLIRAGGRIWQSHSIVSWYVPRASLTALFRQYMQYGFWKVAVIRKHRMPGSLRHLVPACFVAASLAGLAALPFADTWLGGLIVFLWLAMLAVYALANFAASFKAAKRYGWLTLVCLPVVFTVYHFSYGLGFLAGIASNLLRPANGALPFGAWFERVTR